jgi:serine protease Do
VGFAVPSNNAKPVIDALIAGKKVVRGYLGIAFAPVREMPMKELKSLGIKKPDGILIRQVRADTPAEKSGLMPNDVIVKVGGQRVTDGNKFRRLVRNTEPGEVLTLEVVRGGETKKIDVTIGKQPEVFGTVAVAEGEGAKEETLGLVVTDLTPEQAKELGYEGVEGVLVKEVEAPGEAAAVGVKPNDVIIQVQGKPVKSVEEFKEVISKASLSEGINLVLRSAEGIRAVFIQRDQ